MKQSFLPSIITSGSSQVEIHYVRPITLDIITISRSQDAETYLRAIVDRNKIDYKEFFWVVHVSALNKVLAVSEIAIGSHNNTCVNIKEIFQQVLLLHSLSILVAHNHPSGNLKFSESDKKITKKLQEASKLLDVSFLDHLILTSESYRSMADEGLL